MSNKNLVATLFATILAFSSMFATTLPLSVSAQSTLEWPVVGQNLERTGFVDGTAPNTSHLLWKFKMDGVQASWGALAVAEGKAFVGCESTGDIYAIDVDTGQQVWHRNLNQHGYLTYDSGKIYAMGGTIPHDPVSAITGDTLNCLNAENGNTIWTYVLPQSLWMSPSLPFFPGSPAVYNGRVYKSTLGMVFIWDANNGTLLKTWQTGDFSSRFLSFYQGDIIGATMNFTDGTKHVYRGDPLTQTMKWVSPAVDSFGGVAMSADNIYLAGDNYLNLAATKDVYRIDARDGTIHWSLNTDGAPYSTSVAYNKVYTGSSEGYVYCIDKFVGPAYSNWKFTAGGAVQQDIAVADEKVFFGSMDGYVYALDALTGELIWKYKTGGALVGAPAIAGGKLFIGANDRYLYCFGPAPTSSMSISAPTSITVGQSVTMTGRLVNGTGAGIGDASVTLSSRVSPSIEWSDFATVTTASDGSFSYTLTPPFDGYYGFSATFDGPEIGGYASSTAATTVRVAPTTPEVTVDLPQEVTDALGSQASAIDRLESAVSTLQTYLIAVVALVVVAIAVSAFLVVRSRKTTRI